MNQHRLQKKSCMPRPLLIQAESWGVKVENFQQIANQLNIIIIGVNGGTSFYHESPLRDDLRYKSHLIKELIPAVNELLPVRTERQHRAIIGHSMGAMGTAYLGLKYPQLFAAMACRSGAFHLVEFAGECAFNNQFPKDISTWELGTEIYGPEISESDYKKWAPVCLIEIVAQNQLPEITINIGLEDQMPGFVKSNQIMHQKLLDLDIPHTYTETEDDHDWTPYLYEFMEWVSGIISSPSN